MCCRRLRFEPDAEIYVRRPDVDLILELAALRARRADHGPVGNRSISASAGTPWMSRVLLNPGPRFLVEAPRRQSDAALHLNGTGVVSRRRLSHL